MITYLQFHIQVCIFSNKDKKCLYFTRSKLVRDLEAGQRCVSKIALTISNSNANQLF